MDSPILPFSVTVTDFKLPTFSRLTVRRRYHDLDDESKEKLNTAFTKLKELPLDHFTNYFNRQANIILKGDLAADGAHFGLSFNLFHRVYLYMLERMLQAGLPGDAIGMPYWDSTLDGNLPYPADTFRFSDAIRPPEGPLSGGPYAPDYKGNLSSDVDRRWTVWRTLGGKRTDITDPELLQKTLLFYDENNNLVRAKVEDFMDNEKLGYTYQDMPNPRSKKFEPFTGKNLSSAGSSLPAATAILPATLDETLKFYVTRPPATSSMKKKLTEDEEEVLNFYVEYDETKNIRFDVYLNENKDADLLEVEMAEYAGSFINFAQPQQGSDEQTKTTTTWSLAIAEVLRDLALGGENKIPVTLLPICGVDVVTVKSADITGTIKTGGGAMTVKSAKIDLVPC